MYKLNFYFLFFCVGTIAVVAGVNLKAHRAHVPHRNPDGRIIGGHEAEPHSVPYAVALIINGDAFCGGSLISPNYVLTAAHCGTVIYEVEVILGAHNRTTFEPTQQRFKENVTVINHENYQRSTYNNDITLLKLPYSATLNEYVKTVKLPSRADANKSYIDQVARAIGWGLTFDKDHAGIDDISKVLMYVDVQVMENEECAEYFNTPETAYVYDGNFCTSGYRSKGTCGGDSGGPLVLGDVQIGLTSFGSDVCEYCVPSVYTRVGKYIDWIEKHSDVKIN